MDDAGNDYTWFGGKRKHGARERFFEGLGGPVGAEIARARFARADFAEVIKAENAGGVAVGELDLDRVAPHGSGGACGDFRLEHGKNGRAASGFRFEPAVFFALFAAGGAGTVFAEVHEIVVASVGVGPDDVHAFTGGDADFYVHGLFAQIERNGHSQTFYQRWCCAQLTRDALNFHPLALTTVHRDRDWESEMRDTRSFPRCSSAKRPDAALAR